MKRIKQSPKLPADLRHEQLLLAAERMFLRKGYRDTTTEEIAESAGLTKGALYFHFASKGDILLALVKSLLRSREAALSKVAVPGVEPGLLFETIMQFSVRCGIYKGKNNIDFWIEAISFPHIRRLVNRHNHRALDLFARSIHHRYGSTLKKRHELAIFTFSLCDGLSVRRVFHDPSVDLAAQAALYRALVTGRLQKRRTIQ
jgi:AcrR family transcriptional regulator